MIGALWDAHARAIANASCRKTGLTIKDTGRRDEHGFEPLDAIFSSPEKSPPKRATQAASSEPVDWQESMRDVGITVLRLC